MSEEVKSKKEGTAPAKVPRGVPLKPRQWAEADALWESGDVTYKDLTERFGKDWTTFRASFEKRGIVKGSAKERVQQEVKAIVEKDVVGDAGILAARIKETKEEVYKMASGIRKLSWAEILKAKNGKVPFGAILNDIKALDAAATLLKKTQEISYTVLGLNDENFIDEEQLPELVVSELTAEQVTMLKNRDTLTIDDVVVPESEDSFDVVEEGTDDNGE